MGAGASASIGEAATAATKDDIKAMFGKLPDAERNKIMQALSETKDGGNAGDAKDAGLDQRGKCDKIHECFDKDKDGFLNQEEFAEAAMIINGWNVLNCAWPGICKDAGCDDKEKGLSTDALYKFYTEPDGRVCMNDIDEDYGLIEAPFLNAFFVRISKAQQELLMEDPEAMIAMLAEEGGQEKLKQEGQKLFQKKLKPLLEKSFKHHDTKNTGVLDKEEAQVFFKNLTTFSSKMVQGLLMFEFMGQAGRMMQNKPEAAPPVELIRKYLDKVDKQTKAAVQEIVQDFLKDKASKTAAAFKVVDTSGDGSIQLEELCAVFEPDSEKSLLFKSALGLCDEGIKEKLQGAVTEPGEADCVVQ